MIQRQQSLWLFAAAIVSFLTFQFPFYTGNRVENTTSLFAELDAASNFPLLILTGISILLGLVTIFLYKDRKIQLRMAIGGIVLSIILLIVYFTEMQKFEKGNFALTAVLAVAIPVFYILAARGIWQDQKLVKSLDKLR